jgi:hypothetical protein
MLRKKVRKRIEEYNKKQERINKRTERLLDEFKDLCKFLNTTKDAQAVDEMATILGAGVLQYDAYRALYRLRHTNKKVIRNKELHKQS